MFGTGCMQHLRQEFVQPILDWLQARPIREAMFKAPWYLALPGPARQLIMQELMSSLVREHVWHAVEQPVWEQRWAEVQSQQCDHAWWSAQQQHSYRAPWGLSMQLGILG